MTGEEKQTIYNLLRTASRNVYGYTTPAFADEKVKLNVTAPQTQEQTQIPTQAPLQQAAPAVSRPQNAAPVSQNISVQTPAFVSNVNLVSNPVQKPEQVPVSSSGGISMGELIVKIARCTRCSLARTRNNVVPGVGSRTPEVLVIGDAPGAEENASGLSFTGSAGTLMDKMLGAIKLDRNTNCFLTNCVKCAVPQNRDPYPEETDACSGFLEAQIKCLKPKAILCAGRVPSVSLLKNNQNVNLSLSIDQLHGQWFDYNGIPVFITWNPSEVLKNQNLKKPVWDDLRAFAAKLKELSPSYAALFNQ